MLVFGVAGVGATTAVSSVLIGCEDESKPEYYVKRLDDPALRPQAVKRLVQFFEDAMTRADKKIDDPNVKTLLDKLVPPLTKTYLGGNLDDRSKLEIIKLLSDSRDVRAKAAWVKALQDFQPGAEDEAKYAARAIAKAGIKDQDAMDGMINAFIKLQAGSEKGGAVWREYKEAMTELSSPSWEPQLLERLNRPMEMVTEKDKDAKDKIAAFRSEQFWQVTSAEILGTLGSAKAVKPLFKCIVNPAKADVAATAVLALVKLAKTAMPELNEILAGKSAEINEYTKGVVKQGADVAHLRSAALVIGTIGRADGAKPLMEAIANTKDDVTKAVFARELAKLPSSPESLKVVLEVLAKMPVSVVIPPGDTAAVTLTESLDSFYDPSVVEILVKRGNDAKGSDEDKNTIRDSSMVTMIHLMKKGQVDAVEKAIGAWAPKPDENKLEKEAFAKSKAVLLACEEKIECYLAKIEDPSLQEQKDQVSAIKAAYMLGVLGNDSTRGEMIKRLPKIKNAAIKFSVGRAIDHLAPNGDKAGADAIKKIMDDNKQKGDQNIIQGDNSLKHIMQRLLARL
jgi:hypothetical protein